MRDTRIYSSEKKTRPGYLPDIEGRSKRRA